MNKINNLSDLKALVGEDVVNKCFTEYVGSVLSTHQRVDDMLSNRAVMTENEMNDYIEKIGRSELFEEIDDLRNPMYAMIRRNGVPYPLYLKAILVSLVEQGYDQEWVTTTFKRSLEDKYLKKPE